MAPPARVERAETSEAVKETKVGMKSDRCADVVSHTGGEKVGPGAVDHDNIDRGGGPRCLVAHVGDPGDQAQGRAQGRVSGMGVPDCFTAHTILLRCECESGERSGQQIRQGTQEHVKFACAEDPQADVLKAEQANRRTGGGEHLHIRPDEAESRNQPQGNPLR